MRCAVRRICDHFVSPGHLDHQLGVAYLGDPEPEPAVERRKQQQLPQFLKPRGDPWGVHDFISISLVLSKNSTIDLPNASFSSPTTIWVAFAMSLYAICGTNLRKCLTASSETRSLDPPRIRCTDKAKLEIGQSSRREKVR